MIVTGVSREVVPVLLVRVWAMVEMVILGTGVRGESVETGGPAEDVWGGVNSGGQGLDSV